MTEQDKKQDNKVDEKGSAEVMRRRFRGTVVSDANDQTIVVAVERKLQHKLYSKLYTRTRKFHVHDSQNKYAVGDVVEFIQCRPISKKKRWRVIYDNSDNQ